MQCLRASDISWCDAAGNYVRIYGDSREFVVRSTLADMARRLEGHRFLRISRTTTVNLERIVQVVPLGTGEYDVQLQGGWCRRLSRRCRTQFMEPVFAL
jgi:two-component system LytT family response regulator